MSKRQEAGGIAAACALVAVFTLGQAIQASNGALHPVAIRHLAVALGMLVMGVLLSQARGPALFEKGVLVGLGGLATAYQLSQLASAPPGIYLRGVSFTDYTATLLPFAVLAASLLAKGPWLGRLHGVAFLVAFWILGSWLIKASPDPFIDVYAWTHHALKALAHGDNPFVVWMPNLYKHTLWYAPDMADSEWVRTGFPYPPLSLMLSGIGWIFGDMRWANLGLMVLAGAALLWGRGKYGVLAAVLLLTTPRVLFVLEQAWTDAYIIGLMGITLWCAARQPKWTAFAFGALVCAKQYMVFLMPLGLLLVPPPWDRKKVLRFVGEAIIVALVINLPWLLWNPKALIGSNTVSGHPFRPEALSFLAATAVNGKPVWPLYIQLVLMIPAYALVAWKGARGPAGFALACALVLSVFFSFSKHAFCNHHFLVLGCAALALGFASAGAADPAPAAEKN
ncbi:MAG: hypothetical protein IT380_28130 [Myxococcales bacterium]|nr:hypothetical protein [Myxococcales bacterium]